MYNAKQIANYIINYCHANNIFITNLRLQKLLYFLQGENCRYNRNRLISDDFYAWQLGPVIPTVYSDYAIYSSSLIPKQNTAININEETASFINLIINKYSNISTWDLVDISHKQDPWKYNYEIFGDKSIIPFESIFKYFEEQSNDDRFRKN